MRKGELFLKAWAAPTERSAAPIDLNNMVEYGLYRREARDIPNV